MLPSIIVTCNSVYVPVILYLTVGTDVRFLLDFKPKLDIKYFLSWYIDKIFVCKERERAGVMALILDGNLETGTHVLS